MKQIDELWQDRLVEAFRTMHPSLLPALQRTMAYRGITAKEAFTRALERGIRRMESEDKVSMLQKLRRRERRAQRTDCKKE